MVNHVIPFYLLIGAMCIPARGTVPSPGPQLQLSGRTLPGPSKHGLGSLPQLFTWPGTSARVTFEGSASVAVVVNGGRDALPDRDLWVVEAARLLLDPLHPTFAYGTSYFQFEIDDQAVAIEAISADHPVLHWEWSGLDTGIHTLTITLLSEPRYGVALLQSITLGPGASWDSCGGRFLPPIPPPHQVPGRRMLILGDSYSVGFGNLGGPSCAKRAEDENALLAYAPLAARQLGAEFQLVAWSGAGSVLYPGEMFYGEEYPLETRRAFFPTGSELLGRQDALDPRHTYNLSSWVPQVVLLALGTNDFHKPDILPPVGEWVAQYLAYVRQVAAAFPSAHLLQVVFPAEVQMQGLLDAGKTLQYLQYHAAAFSRMQAEGLPNVHFLQLTGEGVVNASEWCFFHPDVATHKALAQQVVSFIQESMPWFAAGGSSSAA